MRDIKNFGVQELLAAILQDPSLCYRDQRVCLAGVPISGREILSEGLRDRDRIMPAFLGTPSAS